MTDEKKKEYLERLEGLRFIDDDFMCVAFKDDPEAVEEVLNPIMNIPNLSVKKVTVQDERKNLLGRSVRLDVVAVDATGKHYDIEVQRADKGAGAKRARYNLGMMDSGNLAHGEDFDNLPETWVIFITENDVLKGNLPIYHIERVIQETGAFFNDGEHIIYVNGKDTSDTELGHLMADFQATKSDQMHSKVLAKKMRYFKESKEGREAMCKVFEDLQMEATEKATVQSTVNAIKAAKAPFELAVSLVANALGLTEEVASQKVSAIW